MNFSYDAIKSLRYLRVGSKEDIFVGENDFDDWSDAQLGALSSFVVGDLIPSTITPKIVSAISKRAQRVGHTLPSIGNFYHRYSYATADWTGFARDVASGYLDDFTLGSWLMSVAVSGLDEAATKSLTLAMANSGYRHDYRNNIDGYFVRRYPTGALSEKIALIMPTILLFLQKSYGIQINSPFLIARALGHTGGTRDKLSALPGFRLPEAGDETEAMLREVGVCYVATSNTFNPADDRLYSLRSLTNTIESEPLIIASIASKMLACPVDLMQLDARWGDGAFFCSRESAEKTASRICRLISVDGQLAFATITDANHPNGASLGAAAEVAEAICCLRDTESLFDYRGISYQQRLVADFAARLVGEVFSINKSELYRKIMFAFSNDEFLGSFLRLMVAHGVSENYLRKLWEHPCLELQKMRMIRTVSPRSGRLKRINQVALGEFLRGEFCNWSIVLYGRPGDFIQAGSPLFDLYVPHEAVDVAVMDASYAIMEV